MEICATMVVLFAPPWGLGLCPRLRVRFASNATSWQTLDPLGGLICRLLGLRVLPSGAYRFAPIAPSWQTLAR